MPTDQELSSKEKESANITDELSEVQFSAHISEELTEPEIAGEPIEELSGEPEPDEEEILRREQLLREALEEAEKNAAALPRPVRRRRRKSLRIVLSRTVRLGAGIISLALTLVVLGIVLMVQLFSQEPDMTMMIRFAPLAGVFIGVELLLFWLLSGGKFRIHIPALCATVIIAAGGCILAVSMTRTLEESVQKNNDRAVEAEIYELSYQELKHTADISKLDIRADMLPDSGKKRGAGDITLADRVSITVELDGYYASPREFAAECGRIMDVYDDLGIPVEKYRFSAQTRLMEFRLDVEGRFQQDYSDEKLKELVRYVYIEDYDFIQDLADFTEETTEIKDAN